MQDNNLLTRFTFWEKEPTGPYAVAKVVSDLTWSLLDETMSWEDLKTKLDEINAGYGVWTSTKHLTSESQAYTLCQMHIPRNL